MSSLELTDDLLQTKLSLDDSHQGLLSMLSSIFNIEIIYVNEIDSNDEKYLQLLNSRNHKTIIGDCIISAFEYSDGIQLCILENANTGVLFSFLITVDNINGIITPTQFVKYIRAFNASKKAVVNNCNRCHEKPNLTEDEGITFLKCECGTYAKGHIVRTCIKKSLDFNIHLDTLINNWNIRVEIGEKHHGLH